MIVGAARVRQAFGDTAGWIETLERETVARMNAGLGRDSVEPSVQPSLAASSAARARKCFTLSSLMSS